jgi:hypothetical protein
VTIEEEVASEPDFLLEESPAAPAPADEKPLDQSAQTLPLPHDEQEMERLPPR